MSVHDDSHTSSVETLVRGRSPSGKVRQWGGSWHCREDTRIVALDTVGQGTLPPCVSIDQSGPGCTRSVCCRRGHFLRKESIYL